MKSSPSRKTPAPAWSVDLADRLLVLTNPTRLEILADLVAHPGTIAREVSLRLGLTEQAVCQHLKSLRAAGLIADRRNGPQPRRGGPGKTLTVMPGPAVRVLEAAFDLLNGEGPASLPGPTPEPAEGAAA